MKQFFLLLCFILAAASGHSQNIDSLIAVPQVLELKISTPQPRLNETFQVSVDADHLKANIFRPLAAKLTPADDIMASSCREFTINVVAPEKGKNEIGPLEFYLNKTRYTTNKIVYEVVDPLPETNQGVWFRKVMTSDTSFCIIIEQRIPAFSKTTQKTDNSTTYTTEPEHNDIVKFKDSYSIKGLNSNQSNVTTNFSSVMMNGESKQYMSGYSVYNFTIVDKKARIKITKDKFEHIPDYYHFEEIIIQ